MSHLSLETIARLVDDAPDAEEKAHIEACPSCRRDIEDMRADLARLQALPAIEPPAGDWEHIELRLAAEGLLRRPRTGLSLRSGMLRAAAAIAIFLMGGVAGAAWTGARPAGLADTVGRSAARLPGGDVRPAPAWAGNRGESDNVLAAAVMSGRLPDTRDETTALLGEAEALYLNVLERAATMNAGVEGGDPVARLAALQGITAITRAALDRAPADPVLNGYHITALAQREATLRQIAAMTGGSWF